MIRRAASVFRRASRGFVPLLAVAALLACPGCRADGVSPQTAHLPAGSGGVNRPEHHRKPHVILISLDGFKPVHLERYNLPNVRRIAERGARARAMVPVFPTLTFPNHFSLVTGVYPETHGIVANSFYDPDRSESYALSTAAVTDGTWYRAEPIWVTAERQGMVAACYFWPGSEAAIRPAGAPVDAPGIRPTVWNTYDGQVPNAERVRTVLEWLRLPDDRRPHLITLYFSDLDSAQHQGSLDDPRVEAAANAVDVTLGALLEGLEALSVRDRVYLIVTSDHGMVETSDRQAVQLDSLVDKQEIDRAFGGPIASLHLKDRTRAPAIRDRINARLKRGRAYLRSEVPQEHHYRADPRIGDIVVIMDEAWTLVTSRRAPGRNPRGMHGWPPAFESMQALFMIMGPGVRPGTVFPEVRNIDVYPLMTDLLGLEPAKNIAGDSTRIRRAVGLEP